MAYPTATTCGKCGAVAAWIRFPTIVSKAKELKTLGFEVQDVKLGMHHLYQCPNCGLRSEVVQYPRIRS